MSGDASAGTRKRYFHSGGLTLRRFTTSEYDFQKVGGLTEVGVSTRRNLLATCKQSCSRSTGLRGGPDRGHNAGIQTKVYFKNHSFLAMNLLYTIYTCSIAVAAAIINARIKKY